MTGNGEISSYDASAILKYIVGIDVAPFRVGEWTFYCESREVCPLEGVAEGQDFVGLLYGDVSGSWGADWRGGGEGTQSRAVLAVGKGFRSQ